MTGAAALWQHRHPVDRCRLYDGAAEEHIARSDFRVADDPAGQPGHQPVAGIVVGVVDSGVELGLGRGRGEPGKELQNLALIAGPGRRHLTLFHHPRGRLRGEGGMMRKMDDGGAVLDPPPTDNSAGWPDLD